MKLIILLLSLSLCFGCNQKQAAKKTNTSAAGLDTAAFTYSVSEEDTSMNAAIDKAKKTINKFDSALNSNNSLYTDFAVKKRYSTPDGDGEHIWIGGVKLVNGYYKGIINNDVEKTTEVKYGDTVLVGKNEITDWMYIDNNVLKGGYTIREIRSHLNKEQQDKMDKELGCKIENE